MSAAEISDTSTQRQYLQIALEEAQATVRAYDTKAQIVGIGYTFALNIVANVTGGLPGTHGEGPLFVAFFWLIVMAPLPATWYEAAEGHVPWRRRALEVVPAAA